MRYKKLWQLHFTAVILVLFAAGIALVSISVIQQMQSFLENMGQAQGYYEQFARAETYIGSFKIAEEHYLETVFQAEDGKEYTAHIDAKENPGKAGYHAVFYNKLQPDINLGKMPTNRDYKYIMALGLIGFAISAVLLMMVVYLYQAQGYPKNSNHGKQKQRDKTLKASRRKK